MNRKLGFAALLAVIGASIVFGMILGGRLSAPPLALAARGGSPFGSPAEGAYAPTVSVDFATIAESAMPAVVGVTNTLVRKGGEEADPHDPFRDDPFFRWFFGPPDEQEGPRRPERSVGFGSGFIVSPDGYIMTNNHVVERSTRLTVELNDGEKYEAKVVGTDPSIDLALIKIEPGGRTLPTLPLGDSDRLRVGEWVLAIGNPLGLDHTVTVGVVSAKGRRGLTIGTTDIGIASFIQTDAAINFGNSGGPLLDVHGRVVGISTAIERRNLAEGIGFAVPINEARGAAEQLRETGSVKRGYLGVTMNQTGIDDEAREYYGLPDKNGVIVTAVERDGPAGKAGVRKGDVIRKVDGDAIKDNLALISKVASRRPGDRVRLEIQREGKPVELTVTLAARDLERMARRGGRNAPAPEREEGEPDEATGLGVKVGQITPWARQRYRLEEDAEGVVVTEVQVDSEAADKGIETGMVVVSLNDRPIRGIEDWTRTVKGLRVGDPVKVEVRAGDRDLSMFLRVPRPRD